MFLYQFVRQCRRSRSRPLRRRPTFVHTITFYPFFGFLSFLHDCWPWPTVYMFRFWSIFLVMLTLNCPGQIWNLLYLNQNWSDCHETESKHIDWSLGLNVTIGFDLGNDLDLEFSRSNMEFSISHETKSKHIDWILGLKYGHQVWPWPWSWSWSFKVKYWVYYISTKRGTIATKQKANISIELHASNATNGFKLGHALDLWISKVKCDLDLCPHACPWAKCSMIKF